MNGGSHFRKCCLLEACCLCSVSICCKSILLSRGSNLIGIVNDKQKIQNTSCCASYFSALRTFSCPCHFPFSVFSYIRVTAGLFHSSRAVSFAFHSPFHFISAWGIVQIFRSWSNSCTEKRQRNVSPNS